MPNPHEESSSISTSAILCALLGCYSLAKFIITKMTEAPLSEYASFAELNGDVENLDSKYNETIYELSKRCNFSKSEFDLTNPPIKKAYQYFLSSHKVIQTEMLQRNSYLLSRLFLQNFSKLNLNQQFQANEIINVLDVGCSLPVSLPGLLAYFNPEKVRYHGIDNYKEYIDDSCEIFKRFKNVQFSWVDGNQFLTNPKNQQFYDVILFQHPNLSHSEQMTKDFINMFINAQYALAPGGIMYVTFYYLHEAKLFIEEIADMLPSLTFNPLQNSDLYRRRIKFNSEQGQIAYSPELFTIASMPKASLELPEIDDSQPKIKFA